MYRRRCSLAKHYVLGEHALWKPFLTTGRAVALERTSEGIDVWECSGDIKAASLEALAAVYIHWHDG